MPQPVSTVPPMPTLANGLSNSSIAELLARMADTAKFPLQKALRRAARSALLWPEEAAQLILARRPLTELSGLGPHLERLIIGWMDDPPDVLPPSDLRRDFLTLTQARAALRKKLAWSRGLKGDLQMHSVWSDGSGSISEMAQAGDERGYEYISITDHSQGLKIAGGIDEAQLLEQGREIQDVNRAFKKSGRGLRVLRSIELNLNPRGEGDMSRESLAQLDIVLGCFHSSLRTKEDQTNRYLAALRNPDIQILGHPRGRIYNYRLGLTADWPRVFATAAELDKAVEIDSYPDRQDLSLDLVRLAKKAGCRISLGTDSHGPTQLQFIEFGLAAACMAAIPRERILNFMDREALLAWVANVRKSQKRNGNSDTSVSAAKRRVRRHRVLVGPPGLEPGTVEL